MARRPRIEMAGYYHIINRGVEQRVVFKEADDYEYFEELMCFYMQSHGVTLHNYCLMPNHYHLLIETSTDNLSKFMRQLNMNYAIYFNKKYKRVGHLWQGRFKSWYVTDEAYLYTLMRYIEQNPLKAKMVKRLEEYPYSSYQKRGSIIKSARQRQLFRTTESPRQFACFAQCVIMSEGKGVAVGVGFHSSV